ncbi:uncharacterized protein LOC112091181 [Morus notabilis]|uniref:uncharacterized protein LOC112091181 n=1 Tax=Morus notabilis TaxID=981085 RepID=UPI000CED306F|nr:uncharacterized protein LOC112091181 [Morus notabilis]
MSVTEYYTTLTKLWQELDLFGPNDWCGECLEKYVKLVEKTGTYDFLAGLNKDLDEVRGRMIGIRPLPQIEEVFAEVRREENRRKIMLGDPKGTAQTKASALGSKSYEQNRKPNFSNEPRRAKKGNLWCDYCQRANHTKETCWKLHGKPPNQYNREHQRQPGQFQKEPRAYQSNAERVEQKAGENLGSINLSKEQLERLYKLLTPEKVTGTSLIAQQGCAQLFCSYAPNYGHAKVRIAYGTLSPIARIGTIKINSLVLKYDQGSGKRIGNASKHEGLYYFDEGTDKIKQVHIVSWEPSSWQNQGETNSEGNFWHFSSEILNSTTSEIPNSFTSPNVPLLEPNPSHSENLNLPRVENFDVVDESNKQGGNLDVENNQEENKVPDLDVQQQKSHPNTKLHVYSRRKN